MIGYQLEVLHSVCGSDTDPIWRRLLAAAGQPEPSVATENPPAAPQEPEQTMLDLYESFARAGAQRPAVIAHLGQSMDGFIATGRGDSFYVTGPANLDHLHRMRALADAIVVGSGTVAADDPALTTRRVSGPNPVRVVLDGRRRLHTAYRVFSDRAAATVLMCGDNGGAPSRHGEAEVLPLPQAGGQISAAAVLASLAGRGLHRVFVEGGGRVVSDFLAAGVLHRLQLTIAPVLIGTGRRGVAAPAQARMRDCLRPAHRLYRMGEDLLFDYDLSGEDCDPVAATVERLR